MNTGFLVAINSISRAINFLLNFCLRKMLHFPYKAKIPEDIPAVRGGKGAFPSRQGRCLAWKWCTAPKFTPANDGQIWLFWDILGISILNFFGGVLKKLLNDSELQRELQLKTSSNESIEIGKRVPSRELTYPPKMAFWRWFSFSQGGIC